MNISDKFIIFYLELIHHLILTRTRYTIMMLQVANLLSKLFQLLVMSLTPRRLRIREVKGKVKFTNRPKQSSHIPVALLVIGISGEIPCPVKTTIIIPNRKDIL